MKIDKNFLDRELSDIQLAHLISGLAAILLWVIVRTFDLPPEQRAIWDLYITLSILVAKLGEGRKIGFGTTYIISLLFSPLIGCIAALASERKK
jgi:hypothetical protein